MIEIPDQNLTNPERSLASPYLSGSTAHSARPTHFPGLLPLWTDFSGFWADFFWSSKTSKKHLFPERYKISKIGPLGTQS